MKALLFLFISLTAFSLNISNIRETEESPDFYMTLNLPDVEDNKGVISDIYSALNPLKAKVKSLASASKGEGADKFFIESSYSLHTSISKVFSVVVYFNYYTGGRRVRVLARSYNLRIDTGEYIKIESFISDRDYFRRAIFREISSDFSSGYTITSPGEIPLEEALVYLRGDSIYFEFPHTTMGTYTLGRPSFSFPLKDSKRAFDPLFFKEFSIR